VGYTAKNHRGHTTSTEIMTWPEKRPWLHRALLILYYFAVIVILIVMYGRGDFSTPPFVYQGF